MVISYPEASHGLALQCSIQVPLPPLHFYMNTGACGQDSPKEGDSKYSPLLPAPLIFLGSQQDRAGIPCSRCPGQLRPMWLVCDVTAHRAGVEPSGSGCCRLTSLIYCCRFFSYCFRKFEFNPRDGIDNPALSLAEDSGKRQPWACCGLGLFLFKSKLT